MQVLFCDEFMLTQPKGDIPGLLFLKNCMLHVHVGNIKTYAHEIGLEPQFMTYKRN